MQKKKNIKMILKFLLTIFACFIFNGIITLPVVSLQELSDNEVDSDDNYKIDLTDLGNTMYGVPSKETGKKVAEWREDDGINPEELGEYAQGDILFPPSASRSGLRSEYSRWPNGIIPYMISPSFTDSERAKIMSAIDMFHRFTCLRFIQRTGEKCYLRITSGYSGCWSSVGYTGSRFDVNLQRPGCVTKIGTIIHELMHAIGIIHEQGRSDRDDNVIIRWDNIKPGAEANFQKYPKTTINDFEIPYDYASIMHYSNKAFTKNGEPTIVPKHNKNIAMGQRDGFTANDIMKVKRMYNCNEARKIRQIKSSRPGKLFSLLSLLLSNTR